MFAFWVFTFNKNLNNRYFLIIVWDMWFQLEYLAVNAMVNLRKETELNLVYYMLILHLI